MKFFLHSMLSMIAVMIVAGQGCSTARVPGGSVPVEDRSSSAAGVPGIATEGDVPGGPQSGADTGPIPRSESPAVVALLDTAQLDMETGRSESAAATLERALRLEPKNDMLWHRLALIRQQQQQWQQVLSLAQKSNSLAAGDRHLQLQNWRLIAEACKQLKDDRGVKHARGMIQRLEEQLGTRG